MKLLIQIAVVALVAGGVSAGGSFYLHQQNRKLNSTSKTDNLTKTDEKVVDDQKSPNDQAGAKDESSKPAPVTPPEHPDTAKSADLNSFSQDRNVETPSFGPPVAARPPFDPTGDEAGDLINRLRARATTASRQERRVADREELMKLIIEDLRAEQSNSGKMRQRMLDETNQSLRRMDEIRRETEAERATILNDQNEARRIADEEIQNLRREKDEAAQAAEEALKSAREEQLETQKQLAESRKSAESRDRSGSPEETMNLKKMIGVVDTMPPEDTAKILKELVEKGKIEAVVAVLNAMKPRQSAKVFSAITESEPTLAADLVDRLKRLKKDSNPPAETPK